MAIGAPQKPLLDLGKAKAEFLDGTISSSDEDELRRNLSIGNWVDLLDQRDRPKRLAFLKDASPTKILLWIMRSPTTGAEMQAQCAIALLPYMPPKKDDIEPPNQT